jgi:hypothetical protein
VISYVRGSCEGHQADVLAYFIKANCLSARVMPITYADSPNEILWSFMDHMFSRPNKLMESVMQPIRDHPHVRETDRAQCLAYYSIVLTIFLEIDRSILL